MGALGLHLGARLESAFSKALGGLRFTRREKSASATEASCEWIEQLSAFELPEMPELPAGASSFQLPPLPGRWLLPEAWWRQVQSMSGSDDMADGNGRSSAATTAIWHVQAVASLAKLKPQPGESKFQQQPATTPLTHPVSSRDDGSVAPFIAAGCAGAGGALIALVLGSWFSQLHRRRRKAAEQVTSF